MRADESLYLENIDGDKTSIVNASVFDALSIGGGLVAAVSMCVELYSYKVNISISSGKLICCIQIITKNLVSDVYLS